MTESDFLEHYPQLYHIATGGSWASIRQYGLESTSALLDRFEVTGHIESKRRAKSTLLNHQLYPSVVIRDQAPISESKLANCLVGMTNAEWYKILNGFVFLWPTAKRRNSMLGHYEQQSHDVLTINTQKFLIHHRDTIQLSSINSGSTLFNPAVRGSNTFVCLSDFAIKERNRRRTVAEIVVPYRIDEIERVVDKVESFSGSQCTGTIWRA